MLAWKCSTIFVCTKSQGGGFLNILDYFQTLQEDFHIDYFFKCAETSFSKRLIGACWFGFLDPFMKGIVT